MAKYIERLAYKFIEHNPDLVPTLPEAHLAVASSNSLSSPSRLSNMYDLTIAYWLAMAEQLITEEFGVVFSFFFAAIETVVMPVYGVIGVITSAKELYQFEHDPDFFTHLSESESKIDYSGMEDLEHLEWGDLSGLEGIRSRARV